MQTLKMSVTRALVELKRLDAQINTAIAVPFVGRVVGLNNNEKVVGHNESKAAVEVKFQANLQKVNQLLKNRKSIKAAIVQSNACTRVKVGEVDMSVAEAIELKTSVALQENLLMRMRQQFLTEKTQVDAANDKVQAEINDLIARSAGADKSKITEDTVRVLTDSVKSQKQQSLLDPIRIEKEIEKLQAQVDVVVSELDFILSESNARTEIEVEV